MAELIIGILALLYGLYTIYLRVRKASKAWAKLDRMKEAYGEKAGADRKSTRLNSSHA